MRKSDREFEAWLLAEVAKLPRDDIKYAGGRMGPQLNGREAFMTEQQCPFLHKSRVTRTESRAVNAHLLRKFEGRTFCVVHGWVAS